MSDDGYWTVIIKHHRKDRAIALCKLHLDAMGRDDLEISDPEDVQKDKDSVIYSTVQCAAAGWTYTSEIQKEKKP